MNIKSTVVIPAHGREDLIERAIHSIQNSNGHCEVEIIVIDDFSPTPIKLKKFNNLTILRSEQKRGAAVSRNIGIEAAQGEIIYLLDSDDYFIDVDFNKDHAQLLAEPGLYYKSIKSQNYTSDFPLEMTTARFFDDILWRYEHISQTSSLCFNKNLRLKFDPSLPKHQDWDFVYSAMRTGIPVRRLEGVIFFDRSDSNSLSRKYNAEISKPWFEKLSQYTLTADELSLCHYNLFCKYPSIYGSLQFTAQSVKLMLARKLKLIKCAKYLAHRIIQQLQIFKSKK